MYNFYNSIQLRDTQATFYIDEVHNLFVSKDDNARIRTVYLSSSSHIHNY